MNRTVEIRSYKVKPGKRPEFDRLFEQASLPMLRRWKIDVVRAGPSLHDEDSWLLIRSYDSLAERQASQDAFYGSDEWRQGPREAILALIETYSSVVIELSEEALKGLRG